MPHGEWCDCTCGRLICQRHRTLHLLTNHSGSSSGGCFPVTSGIESARTLVTATAVLATRTGAGVAPDQAAVFTSFLNVVTPGHVPLLDAVAGRAPSEYRIDAGYWPGGDDGDGPAVVLSDAFFTAGTLERVIILAARELGTAARSQVFRSVEDPVMTEARRQTLDEFRALADKGEAPGQESLRPWTPADVSPGILDELHLILTQPAPATRAAIARWVTETTVQRGALAFTS